MEEPTDGHPVRPPASFRAGVFDLDGVLTATARLHLASWKELFNTFLGQRAERLDEPFLPFSEADYRRYVDGKPRHAGIRSFLQARAITLPEGSPSDSPEQETVYGLGNRKNAIFNQRLQQDGVEVFDSATAFVRALRAAGVRTALVTSSRNADAVLAATGLAELFDVRVDGNDAARLGLAGKPDPDIYLHAADLLGVAPADAFGIEDALAGVAALRAAGYGQVIGVDHAGQAAALYEHGADLVVQDLAELPPPLPDALQHLPMIASQLVDRRPAVFLDYDGTLTPIVARPELAVLDESMRQSIQALATRCPVAIVSGRDRADVERLVGIDGLVYAGSHGFDIAGLDGLAMQYPGAADFLPALDQAETQLRAQLAGIDGALVERKRYAIAVHYRLVAPEHLAAVDAAVVAALAEAPDQLRRTGGKKVFELRVNLPWDKGSAVSWLLDTLGLAHPDVLPFYLGDDETDEDAFSALRGHGGIGILVAAAPQATAAQYRLTDPSAVGRFLQVLTEMLAA